MGQAKAQSTYWHLPSSIFAGYVSRLNVVAARFGMAFSAARPEECARLIAELLLRSHPDKGGDGRSVEEVVTVRLAWREALRSEIRRQADGQPVQPEPSPTPVPTASRPALDIGWIASHYYSAKLVRCGYPGCCGRAERPGAFSDFRKLFDKRVAFLMACALLARLSSICRHSVTGSD